MSWEWWLWPAACVYSSECYSSKRGLKGLAAMAAMRQDFAPVGAECGTLNHLWQGFMRNSGMIKCSSICCGQHEKTSSLDLLGLWV